MNRDRLAGIGRQVTGQLREHWGKLTINPQSSAAGTRDRLAGRIQEQRGVLKEATERELRDFLARNRNWRGFSS